MSEKSISCLVAESDVQRAERIIQFLGTLEGYSVEAEVCDSIKACESCVTKSRFDLVVSKGVFGGLDHEEIVQLFRRDGQDSLVLCLLEDEEKSVILTSSQFAADDYLFYRDLSQDLFVETVRNSFERRAMLAELKASQVATAIETKGVYRGLLHRLDMAVFLFSRSEGELLFSNKVADTWLEEDKESHLKELFDYGVLEVDELELEIETSIASVPCAELRSVSLEWRDRDCSLVTLRNISKRKRAENAYKSSQRRLDLALKSSGLGLWSWDLRKNELHFSERWKAQLGYSGSEFSDTMPAYKEALHPDDRAIVETTFARALRGEAQEIELKYRMRHLDGNYRWILCRAEVYPDESGRLSTLLGTHIDITGNDTNGEPTSLEDLLGSRVSARLERLATEIELCAARVRSNFRGDSAIVEDIQELERLSRSFSGLNEVLQLDANREDRMLEAIDLRYELQQVLRSQSSLLPRRVAVKFDNGDELHIHGVSRRGIRFALTEALACISSSILPDFRSELSITAGLVEGAGCDKRPGIFFTYQGDLISTPDQEALSDLPRVDVACKQLSGRTRLELVFEAGVMSTVAQENKPLVALLADDEAVLRLAIQTMLEKLGFKVEIAGDGAEALDVFSDRRAEIDLALIDMQMPKIDGYAVVGSIHAARPELPIIRMSGDVNDERRSLFGSESISFLAKPFGIASLKAAIEELNLDFCV